VSKKKEYIERGAFIEKLKEKITTNYLNLYDEDTLESTIRLAKKQPAADVEPVVRGELRINEQGFLECSACGGTLRMPLVSTSEMKRCYICGAYLERSGSGE